jgi:hypothetical protein
MARYTIYLLDDQGARSKVEGLACASDAEGINAMLELARKGAAELWQGGRLILGRSAERPTFTRAPRPHLQRAPARNCRYGLVGEDERLAA